MTSPERKPSTEAQRSRAAREVMDRAIRRLNILEVLILGGAVAAAIAGGWLTAWLAMNALGAPFRLTWFTASLLLFAVPGVLVWSRERRAEKRAKQRRETTE